MLPAGFRTFPLLRLTAWLIGLMAAAVAGAASECVLVRVPAGVPVPPDLPALLAHTRIGGGEARVLFLTGGHGEKPGAAALFTALAVLEFPDEGSCSAWLREAASRLPTGVIVRRADILTRAIPEAPATRQSFFLVNTYTPIVPAARYDEFAQGYLRPLYEAQRETGSLVGYAMYLERGETGRVSSLAVLQYRDQAAFAGNPKVKREIRTRLTATVPSYARFHPIKDTLRTDDGGTIADFTEVPPATVAAESRPAGR